MPLQCTNLGVVSMHFTPGNNGGQVTATIYRTWLLFVKPAAVWSREVSFEGLECKITNRLACEALSAVITLMFRMDQLDHTDRCQTKASKSSKQDYAYIRMHLSNSLPTLLKDRNSQKQLGSWNSNCRPISKIKRSGRIHSSLNYVLTYRSLPETSYKRFTA